MTDRYFSDTQGSVETISFTPGCPDTGDLETATKTITATSEPAGVGNASYSASLTLAAPADVRLAVLRIAARLAVTIDSMTAGHLYCRVYVDSQDASHKLFDEDWTTTGPKLDAVDTHAGALATIFASLKDGSARTFYFFFWVSSGNAVLSLAQLWEAVGSRQTLWTVGDCMRLDFLGLVQLGWSTARAGTGAPDFTAHFENQTPLEFQVARGSSTNSPSKQTLVLVNRNLSFYIAGTVSTDLNYVSVLILNLRSER